MQCFILGRRQGYCLLPRSKIGGSCQYSRFLPLTECSRQHISPTTSKTHDYKTTPATKGWRFALMPPWASRHIGGSRSIPTVHRCLQGKAVGSPTAPQLDNKTQTRTWHRSTFVKHLEIYSFVSYSIWIAWSFSGGLACRLRVVPAHGVSRFLVC